MDGWMCEWQPQVPSLLILIQMWCKRGFPSHRFAIVSNRKKPPHHATYWTFSVSHPLRALRGFTSLHLAVYFGRDAVVQQLLAAGAAVGAATKDGRGLGRDVLFVRRELVSCWSHLELSNSLGGSCQWQGWFICRSLGFFLWCSAPEVVRFSYRMRWWEIKSPQDVVRN